MALLNNLTCFEKIIHFDAVKNQYVIRVNEKYYKKIATTYISIGATLGVLCIVLSFNYFWSGSIVFMGVALPLILAGARFLYIGGLKENNIIIDLQQRVIVYSKTLVIPIKTVKHLTVDKTTFREPKRMLFPFAKLKAWQVSIVDHRGNIAPLVKSDNEQKILTIANDLGYRIGVPVQRVSG